MGTIKINYGDSQHIWADGDTLNEVDASATVSLSRGDETEIELLACDSEQEARRVHDALAARIAYGLGNGEIIVTIEDL